MAIVNEAVIFEFDRITKFDLEQLLVDFSAFIEGPQQDILDYYAGVVGSPNENAFSELSRLLGRFNELNDVVENNRDRFLHTLYWELIESISDIRDTLTTIDNSSKWSRSAIAKNDFSPGIEIEHTLKMFQTLEDVSRVIQGSSDPQNEWTTIALRNDLIEEGYTPDGGNKLKLGYRNRATVQIGTVVDTINEESVYGKDFPLKIQFDSAEEDIVTLEPRDTIVQAVQILSSLKQGDCPEFRGEGIQSGLISGSNRAAVSYPILFRQIFSTFQRDDTLKSLRVTGLEVRQDAIFIEVQVETRADEIITQEAQIS